MKTTINKLTGSLIGVVVTLFLFTLILLFLGTFREAEGANLANKYMSASEKAERTCLSKNIYFEARSQGTAGQRSVGYVTMNRVVSNRYPNSICKVVWQNKQFSWTHDGKSDTPINTKAWKRAMMIADYVLNNYSLDITKGSLYYHADYIQPRWAVYLNKTISVGNHIFYTRYK